jgi:hypothetical protein
MISYIKTKDQLEFGDMSDMIFKALYMSRQLYGDDTGVKITKTGSKEYRIYAGLVEENRLSNVWIIGDSTNSDKWTVSPETNNLYLKRANSTRFDDLYIPRMDVTPSSYILVQYNDTYIPFKSQNYKIDALTSVCSRVRCFDSLNIICFDLSDGVLVSRSIHNYAIDEEPDIQNRFDVWFIESLTVDTVTFEKDKRNITLKTSKLLNLLSTHVLPVPRFSR